MKNKHYKVAKVKDRELEDFLNDNYREGYELKFPLILESGYCDTIYVILEKKEDK